MTRKKSDNLEKDIKDIFNSNSDKNGFIKDKHDDFEFEEPNFIEDSFDDDDDDDDIVKLKKDDLVSVFSNHTKDQINEYIKKQKSYSNYSNSLRDKNIKFDELQKEILIRYFYDYYVQKKTMNDRIENLFESIEYHKDFIKFIAITSLISINLLASLKFLIKRK